jgi:hypothetical protein
MPFFPVLLPHALVRFLPQSLPLRRPLRHRAVGATVPLRALTSGPSWVRPWAACTLRRLRPSRARLGHTQAMQAGRGGADAGP